MMDAEKPLISVIIPVYNVSQYIDMCLENVTAQSYTNLEILLIDDGSSDDSGVKCDEWTRKDRRIKAVHKANEGLSAARNTGLELAAGRYIMFIDSDDIVSPDLCELLYEDMRSSGSEVAICDAEHIFNHSYSFSISEKRIVYSPEEAITEMWYQKSFLPSAWGKLYSRKLFEGIRFTEGRTYEDIDVMHLLFWKAERIVYNSSRLYGYVHHEGSITSSGFSEKDLDILLVAHKILEFSDDKSDGMRQAAESYAVTAALRIYLNAPDLPKYQEGKAEALRILKRYGKKSLTNHNIRKKNQYALILYYFCRPFMRTIYNYVNRWKQ